MRRNHANSKWFIVVAVNRTWRSSRIHPKFVIKCFLPKYTWGVIVNFSPYFFYAHRLVPFDFFSKTQIFSKAAVNLCTDDSCLSELKTCSILSHVTLLHCPDPKQLHLLLANNEVRSAKLTINTLDDYLK